MTSRASQISGRWIAPMRLLIVIAVICVFGRIISHDFTRWDDAKTLAENQRMLPPTWDSAAWYWTHPYMDLYVPVTQTLWSGLAYFAYHQRLDLAGNSTPALHPAVFHGASVVVHAIAALAVFELLRRLLNSGLGAFVGALFFALHPVQVESVAWASGMKDLLCGMFSALALWQYTIFSQQRKGPHSDSPTALRQGQKRPKLAYALATTALVLAMLSKPTAMVVPVMAFAIDALLVRRPLRAILVSLSPWFVLSIACAVVAKIVQPASIVTSAPLWARPFIAGDALAFYLYKLVWPQVLVPDHARRPAALMLHLGLYLAWIVPAAIAILLFVYRRRAPVLACAGILFLAGVAPVLGLVTFDFQVYSTVSDHYLYPAMIGIALAAGWTVTRFPTRPVLLAATVIILALAVRSILQAGVWRSDLALWQHQVARQPRSWTGWLSLGNALRLQGDMHQAMEHYARAAQIAPLYATQNYAAALHALGRTDEAIQVIEKFLAQEQSRPSSARAVESLTRMLQDLRQKRA